MKQMKTHEDETTYGVFGGRGERGVSFSCAGEARGAVASVDALDARLELRKHRGHEEVHEPEGA